MSPLVLPDPGDGLGPYVELPLTQGLWVKVSPEDWATLAANKWSATRASSKIYAVRTVSGSPFYMHRAILGAPRGQLCDHRNSDGLDNRRGNLRVCSIAQNAINRRKKPGATSRFHGVSYIKERRKWLAQIKIDGRSRRIGSYPTETEAALAYDRVAHEAHGDFARLNFPNNCASELTAVLDALEVNHG